MDKRLELMQELVNLGYHLFGETPEHFIERLNLTEGDIQNIIKHMQEYNKQHAGN